MIDVTELARLEQLPCQPHGRHEAVVERAHVLDAGGRDPLPDLVALVRRSRQWLLADDVLSRLRRSDRRLGVEVVRPGVVEELHVSVRDQLAPVGRVALEPVPSRRLRDGFLRAPRDGHEPRHERRRPRHVRDLSVGIRVRLAHECVAEHPDSDVRASSAPAVLPIVTKPTSCSAMITSFRTRRRRRRRKERSRCAGRTRLRPGLPTPDPCRRPPIRPTMALRSRSG